MNVFSHFGTMPKDEKIGEKDTWAMKEYLEETMLNYKMSIVHSYTCLLYTSRCV